MYTFTKQGICLVINNEIFAILFLFVYLAVRLLIRDDKTHN